jgi:hypothetical protein
MVNIALLRSVNQLRNCLPDFPVNSMVADITKKMSDRIFGRTLIAPSFGSYPKANRKCPVIYPTRIRALVSCHCEIRKDREAIISPGRALWSV